MCSSRKKRDYLNIHDSLNYTTSPENIINKLKKYKFETCYIKTNEPDLTFFDKLKIYNVKFFKDFDMLKQIYDSGDNYALYSIECCIRNLCDIKISTLNTKQAELCWLPNNDVISLMIIWMNIKDINNARVSGQYTTLFGVFNFFVSTFHCIKD